MSELYQGSSPSEPLPTHYETLTLPSVKLRSETIKEGKSLFLRELSRCGLPVPIFKDEAVISAQCGLVGVLTEDLNLKSRFAALAFGIHYLDDQWDPLEAHETRDLFLECGTDLQEFLGKWGARGQFATAMAQISGNPELAFRGIRRAAFGSLFIHGDEATIESRMLLLKEQFLMDLTADFVTVLEKVPISLFALTNKATQEIFWNGKETLEEIELWNVYYTPGLFVTDKKREDASRESTPPALLPSNQEMIDSLDLTARALCKHISSERLYQSALYLKFIADLDKEGEFYSVIDAYLKAHLLLANSSVPQKNISL